MRTSYCVLRSKTWNDLLKFHKNPPSGSIGRGKEVQEKYNMNHNSNNKLSKKLFPNSNDQIKLYKYMKNDYPYDVGKGIEHNLLWFNPRISPNWLYTRNKVVKEILDKENDKKEYIYFQNKPNNSSVKDIIHYQVFVKKMNKNYK